MLHYWVRYVLLTIYISSSFDNVFGRCNPLRCYGRVIYRNVYYFARSKHFNTNIVSFGLSHFFRVSLSDSIPPKRLMTPSQSIYCNIYLQSCLPLLSTFLSQSPRVQNCVLLLNDLGRISMRGLGALVPRNSSESEEEYQSKLEVPTELLDRKSVV